MFPVSPEKEHALRARMEKLGLKEADLEESFVHARGHGGQNVNKVATCVVLVHLPSGIAVKCQQERSQGLNRFFARRWLCERIEAQLHPGDTPADREAQRLRRQKDRRARRARKARATRKAGESPG
ncbi:MAG: peptide chain release factor-like protein [Myxococcales bacterium]|nr:peptide chain release factor-like protein [Myxococcales bacterium]